MTSIFYDLETSDLCPLGQILNCCFISVDQQWNEIGRLEQNIRLSPLQLPSPDAVLANRTRVLDHHAQAHLLEHHAMRQIQSFITEQIERSGQAVQLIGYNSARFDLNFLRTSFIRNGLNPYFFGRVLPRDLLHGSKFLSASEPTFPRHSSARGTPLEQTRLSLSLETLTTACGLLDGAQAHHSHDDVELTIELAKYYQQKFGFDIRTTAAYPAQALHTLAESHGIVVAISPQYDLTTVEHNVRTPYALLHHDGKNGLWIDLKQYRDGRGRDSIHWFNQNSGALFVEVDSSIAQAYQRDATAARLQYGDLTVHSFFPKSVCDIERDIYRLSFPDIDYLHEAIWAGTIEPIKLMGSADAKSLYVRHRLSLTDWAATSPSFEQRLHDYALYRYGGGCNINKSCGDILDPHIEHPAAHPTLKDLLQRIDTLSSGATSNDDREILSQLRTWYEQSPIMRIAGEELLARERAKPIPNPEQLELNLNDRGAERSRFLSP